jgi:hypothetical protein
MLTELFGGRLIIKKKNMGEEGNKEGYTHKRRQKRKQGNLCCFIRSEAWKKKYIGTYKLSAISIVIKINFHCKI